MKDYVICMDTSGDIPADIVAENNILFVPMEYTLGNEIHIADGCEDESTRKHFYASLRNEQKATTSQISPYIYEEFFRKHLENGESVLYFCLSSGLSGTYNSSRIAIEQLKEDFPNQIVYSIDTLAASGGIGLLVEYAIENKKNGMDIEENYNAIINRIPHLNHYFVVQDLMFLMHGGRLNASSAYLGSMLHIKPILELNKQGKLDAIAKKRGMKLAIQALVDYFEERYESQWGNTVYLCDGDSQDLSELLAKKLLERHPNLIIRRSPLCPVIGAHTGPDMASVIFFGK